MKAIRLFLLSLATTMIVSSCSILSLGSAQQPVSNTDAGINAGTALAAIFGQYKKDNNKIDLGNLANIINIATIANNLGLFGKSLTDDASAAFTQGLIQGSKNLVNKSNASAVLSGLQTLASTNLNQFTKAATKATTDASAAALQQIDATSNQVNTAVTALSGILSALK